MNKAEAVEDLIKFIEKEEKELQVSSDSKMSKSNIVSKILDELERVVDDEN